MHSENNNTPNRLSKEKSPYLKQHQYNPVNWFPWGEEAFAQAKSENKPVFLSVGYSTCHWCHVMEHESFSDPEVAQLLNEVFIPIKVDREERPDVDNVYMTVCQIMTGSGGWPLTVLMTPEGKPFFSGTYFPKESQPNKPGIKDIIKRTSEIWAKFQKDLNGQADEITEQLNSVNYKAGTDKLNPGVFRKGFYELASSYDELYGGFGNRPKFPIPHNFMFLLKYGVRNESPESIDMVTKTLESMRQGGIWDHAGGGFHRYSTDAEWLVPHFEKMLYDEALLSIAYTSAYQVTGDKIFRQTSEEILDYVCRDLHSPDGGFYSAEDADSEGEEGKFYLWSIGEIRQLLIGNVDFFCDVFNIKEKGNYFDEVKGSYTGLNILHLTKSIEQIAGKYNISTEEAQEKIDTLLNKLFEERKERVRPHLDKKILTDWNGLMISALSKAAMAFGESKYAATAFHTLEFIKKEMIRRDFTLNHRYMDGEAGIEGMIDDYAYLLLGILDFYELSSDKQYLELAENITAKFTELFEDTNGGFFFTSSKAEKLISRKKEIYDGATPSGNSVMVEVLLRLSSYTFQQKYFELADKTVRTFITAVNNVPSAYTYLLSTLDRYVNGSIDLVIIDANDSAESLISDIRKNYNPNLNIIVRGEDLSSYAEHIKEMQILNGEITAYICSGFTCSEPVSGIENIRKALTEQHGVRL